MAPALQGSFTHTRSLAAPSDRVFAAFADLGVRRRWFRIPSEPEAAHHELDFRPGGGEVARGTFAASGVPERIEYRSHFFDIVAAERIVYAYETVVDGRRRAVSLATVELASEPGGTELTYTEHYALVAFEGDGSAEVAERQGGLRLQINALQAVVENPAAEP
jgi:uncharacterized protein YndB with AHSA1/START domain